MNDESARTSLVEALESLLKDSDTDGMTIGRAAELLRDRGLALVLIIFTLPFLFPIPTMGLSAPAGFAIALFGLYVALQRQPHLPGFLARRNVSRKTLEKLVHAACKWGHRVERLLKPRLKFMLWPAVNILIGVSLILCGLFLSLPLPIPFTNAVPALAIVLLLLGMIERDGVFILIGQALTAVLAGLCGVIIYLIVTHGWKGAEEIVRGWF